MHLNENNKRRKLHHLNKFKKSKKWENISQNYNSQMQ